MSCGIYKITNNITEKMYIGRSVNIEDRWKHHIGAKDDYAIHKSMRKYGVENFTFEIIEECDESLLDEREQYWIQYYNTYNYGYNLTVGGEGGGKYSHDEIKKLWDEGLGTLEISKITGASLQTISRTLRGDELFTNSECQSRNKGQPFSQYTAEGKWVATYLSYKELSRVMDINIEMVKRCLYDSDKDDKRNISAGGFQWRYGDSKEDIPAINIYRTGYRRKVAQYDKDNNLIKIYSSISEATRETGINHICHCCSGQGKTAGGYIWRYLESEDEK